MRSSTRIAYRPSDRCQLVFKSRRTAGIVMAIPFVLCFALFGVFNLIAGSVLTMMACRNKLSQQAFILIEKMLRENSGKLESFLDPMKAVGTILLTTGSLLVIVGIVLGIVACRSATFDERKRRSSLASFSGIRVSSANGPTSFAVMCTVGSLTSNRVKARVASDNKKTVEPSSALVAEDGVGFPEADDISISGCGQADDISISGCGQADDDIELETVKDTMSVVTCCEEKASTCKSSDSLYSTKSPVKKACSVSWANCPSQSSTQKSSEESVEVVISDSS